jgi:3-hydroxyisobutyrate dehydrogenase-like beta-hydroxyacid dehydrogenase
MQLAIFGLGEAGSLLAADLVAAGVTVSGFDPAAVPTPDGVRRVDDPKAAVVGAEIVLAVTAGADAQTAIEQALDEIPLSALYADLSTNTAGAKRALADAAVRRGFRFVDIALMSTVPGKGVRTPALASGNGAADFAERIAPLGMPITVLEAAAGEAATRKLLRSVMMKGMAGLVIEAIRAAEKAGCSDWVWEHMGEALTQADARFLSRLVRGTGQHAVRRLHEMEAALALLEQLGVDPVMTRSTVEQLRRLPALGLPDIPILPDC